jgi:hypothetical protein
MVNRPSFLVPLLLSLASTLAACGGGGGSFRVVDVAPSSGELALHGERKAARAEAEWYMNRHCPAGRDVLQDGIAVVGSRPASEMTGYGVRLESPKADLVEWRLRYRCLEQPSEVVPLATEAPAAHHHAASAPHPPPAEPAPATPAAPPHPPSDWF